MVCNTSGTIGTGTILGGGWGVKRLYAGASGIYTGAGKLRASTYDKIVSIR